MRIFAISDLHVSHPLNRRVVEAMPAHHDDWLILAGDVGDTPEQLEWTLRLLGERYDRLVWVPGNHELWTTGRDPVALRGEERYRHLVDVCRNAGVHTPEDPYPVWPGDGGPVTVVPLFLLYDYSFRPDGEDQAAALARGYREGIVCRDEMVLHPDPYPNRESWCRARVTATRARLDALDPAARTVLVNHFPLVEYPTKVLRYPVFAQWCGTRLTADWHVRYRAAAVVYGHLHIPRTTTHDGVRHHEVSVGYPREWRRRGSEPRGPRRIMPG